MQAILTALELFDDLLLNGTLPLTQNEYSLFCNSTPWKKYVKMNACELICFDQCCGDNYLSVLRGMKWNKSSWDWKGFVIFQKENIAFLQALLVNVHLLNFPIFRTELKVFLWNRVFLRHQLQQDFREAVLNEEENVELSGSDRVFPSIFEQVEQLPRKLVVDALPVRSFRHVKVHGGLVASGYGVRLREYRKSRGFRHSRGHERHISDRHEKQVVKMLARIRHPFLDHQMFRKHFVAKSGFVQHWFRERFLVNWRQNILVGLCLKYESQKSSD